ncbi:MAG: hypothetical protein AABX51_04810 [Nanoarchaeota archaeon]
MMDDIPSPLFIIAGIGIAIFSTFVALKTDFTRFIFFFIAATGLISFGVIKTIFSSNEKKQVNRQPLQPKSLPPAQFDRRSLDQPLPPPSYPRPDSFARGQLPQMNYSDVQRPAPPQQITRPVRQYRGFYQPHGHTQVRSKFYDRVRKV